MAQTAQLPSQNRRIVRIANRSLDKVFDLLDFVGDFGTFAGVSLKRTFTPPWRRELIAQQLWSLGVRSFPVAIVTALFIGMVMVLQVGIQLVKFGAKNYVPGIAFISNAREMVPAFISMVVGARVAASITAEIGTMRVTEQLDALELLNVDPMRYLVAPRLIAMTFMLPLISAICLVGGYIGGSLIANTGLNIDHLAYYTTTLKFAYLRDVYGGLFKTFVFGIVIAITGCYFGFRTRGGAEGVGRATTNSVVMTLMQILIWDYILSTFILSTGGTMK